MPTTTRDRVAELEQQNTDLARQLEACRAELVEARAQQTAAAEVLQVINASPGELAPVFDAMLENAMALCAAAFGGLWTFDGDRYVATALRGVPNEYAQFLARTTLLPGPGSAPYRFRHGERAVIQNFDLMDEEPYRAGDPQRRALVDLGGARTALQVPLVKDDVVVGVITIYRQEVRPFSHEQIALLQNFAAQAVIAMENARLLTETREALEQQTATAEVLQVINSSPGDLQPVFDTMVDTAARLCGTNMAGLAIRIGDAYRYVATRSLNPEWDAYVRSASFKPERGTASGRTLLERRIIQVADLAADPEHTVPEIVSVGGIRTFLGVPLLREGEPIGVLALARQHVEPFTEQQIALVGTFAAQAVIAMENARLITETREALEQQTATAEVLQVINASPGDLAPVFDAILEKAHSLCDVAQGSLELYDGERFQAVAIRGFTDAFAEMLRKGAPAAENPATRPLIEGSRFTHIRDLAETDYLITRSAAELEAMRTLLCVPLRRDGALLGMIASARREVRPFSDKEIALLENFAAQAVIAMENARLLSETREALEQQTATAEVLQVISGSPTDVQPTFDAIAAAATTLTDAALAGIVTYDGRLMHLAALSGFTPEETEQLGRVFPLVADLGTATGRAILTSEVVHIQDMGGDPRHAHPSLAELSGQTVLAVPMLRDGAAIGAINVQRRRVEPFTDKQIDLFRTFADQAVIAIENVRLFNETREALEQQTAAAEVLQVINSSPGELAPVFDAMLERATALCEAAFGSLVGFDGERFQTLAQRGLPAPYVEYLATTADRPGPGGGQQRVLHGERVVHFSDMKDDEAYRSGNNPMHRAMVDIGGARTGLIVPLRKDDAVVGTFTIYRQEVRPFSDKQISLLENFAAQAVIAMENARLINETREALEQQTATAEVLQVINSSPGDLTPVFNAILEKAMRLCEAAFGMLGTVDGDELRTIAARGLPQAYVEFRKNNPPVHGPARARILAGERVVHILDLRNEEFYRTGDPNRRAVIDLGGARTVLLVALEKDGVVLGHIGVYRQDVRAFSDKQIALLQNFAAQAVIAMENARLLTETREALEQQTATAEVLQVINSSPGDLAPVFEAMLEKATRLCGAALGTLWEYDGERMHPLAMRGVSPGYAEYLSNQPLRPGAGALGSFVRGETILHVLDLKETEAYRNGDTHRRALVDLGGGRTLLGVPLRTDDQLRGAFLIYRREPQPFTEKEIALLENFAAQAVIAMENARLLTETREALAQQTATAEVLQVINSSPGDLAPVFDAMLEKALGLCGAAFGVLWTHEDERVRAAALRGLPPAFAEVLTRGPHPVGADNAHGRLLGGEPAVHIEDVATDEAYRSGDPIRRALVELGGGRTLLAVPLRKDDAFLGSFVIYRREVRPFTDKQIALLQNFAAQAVIAMENARLITETREALEQQTATAEVLQVINSSPGELAPVFQAMLLKAHTLCDASFGALMTYEGERFHAVAHQGTPAPFREFLASGVRPGPGDPFGRMVEGAALSHIHDLSEVAAQHPGEALPRAAVDLGGIRTLLVVPLRKDNALLGAITAYRQEVRPFTDKQIALLQNFAAQAVIAIENARLLTETREALEYQTATSDVLKVISGSGFELQPVLETVVATAVRLCRADQAVIYRLHDGEYRWAASNSLLPEYEAIERETRIRPGPGTLVGRVALEHDTVHILDAWTDPLYDAKDDARTGDIHTMLGVPLMREGTPIGVIGLARRRIEAYTEKEIALVRTFADQAVIAIENARLIGELQQRTLDLQESLEYQTATSDVLKVISRSTFDLQPVLDTLVETASRLCSAQMVHLAIRDGDAYRFVATHSVSPGWDALTRDRSFTPGRGTVTGRTLLERRIVHMADCAADPDYAWPEAVTIGKIRTSIGVPLLREDEPLGVMILARQQVEPFTERQIELVRTFADQAVIAIENARLITETREALEQQTATAEVLQVVNSSPGDLAPVFDAMLERALTLCEASFGFLNIYDGTKFAPAAQLGVPEPLAAYFRTGMDQPQSGDAHWQLVAGEDLIHNLDQKDEEAYRSGNPLRRATVDLGGARSALVVALRKEDRLLGGLTIYRQEVRPFTDKQIALLQNFAAQAVIAIENARLITETRAARDAAEQALAELKTAQANLVHAEKMASLGQLTAGIAHEIKNPLNFVNNFAGLSVELLDELKEAAGPALRTLDSETGAEIDEIVATLTGNLEKIAEHGRRADGIVKSMLDHSRGGGSERRRVDLNALVEEALNLAYHGARAQDHEFSVALERDFDPAATPIELVPQDMTRVLLNLFANGFYAADKRRRAAADGGFRPMLRVATRDLGETVEIRVRDNGIGIAPEHRDRLFQPFFTTKPTGEGTGLGLSISYDIVTQEHGGAIAVDSAPGEFTEFTLRLPRLPSSSRGATFPPRGSAARSRY